MIGATQPSTTSLGAPAGALPEWRVSPGLPSSRGACRDGARAAAIRAGEAGELIWLIEHPPLYTAGTSADPAELFNPQFPVYAAGRGGRYTYHGPGQRVVYVLLDLERRGRDVRRFVHPRRMDDLDAGHLGVAARRAPGGSASGSTIAAREEVGAIGVRVPVGDDARIRGQSGAGTFPLPCA